MAKIDRVITLLVPRDQVVTSTGGRVEPPPERLDIRAGLSRAAGDIRAATGGNTVNVRERRTYVCPSHPALVEGIRLEDGGVVFTVDSVYHRDRRGFAEVSVTR